MLKTCSRDLFIISGTFKPQAQLCMASNCPLPWTLCSNIPPTPKMLCLRHIRRAAWHDLNHFQNWLCTWNLKLVKSARDSPENLVKNFRNPFVSDVARSKQCWLIFSIFFWFSIESIVKFSFHTSNEKKVSKIVFDFEITQKFLLKIVLSSKQW